MPCFNFPCYGNLARALAGTFPGAETLPEYSGWFSSVFYENKFAVRLEVAPRIKTSLEGFLSFSLSFGEGWGEASFTF